MQTEAIIGIVVGVALLGVVYFLRKQNIIITANKSGFSVDAKKPEQTAEFSVKGVKSEDGRVDVTDKIGGPMAVEDVVGEKGVGITRTRDPK